MLSDWRGVSYHKAPKQSDLQKDRVWMSWVKCAMAGEWGRQTHYPCSLIPNVLKIIMKSQNNGIKMVTMEGWNPKHRGLRKVR